MEIVPFLSAANDNRQVPVPTDLDIAGYLMESLDHLLIDEDLRIEGLFLAMINVASRSALGPMDQPTTPDDLGRYNQLSRLSGVLEIFLAKLMKDYCDRLVRFGMTDADEGV